MSCDLPDDLLLGLDPQMPHIWKTQLQLQPVGGAEVSGYRLNLLTKVLVNCLQSVLHVAKIVMILEAADDVGHKKRSKH